MKNIRRVLNTCLVLALVAAASCGSDDSPVVETEAPAGEPAHRSTGKTGHVQALPDAIDEEDYDRLIEELADLPERVIPRLEPAERLSLTSEDAAREQLLDAIAEGEFEAADRVLASAPLETRIKLLLAVGLANNESWNVATNSGDYSTAYRFERYLRIDHGALWQLDGEYLAGRVVDAGSGAAVPGATVVAQDPFGTMATTGADGRFRLLVPPQGAAIRIDHTGYASDWHAESASGQSLRPAELSGEEAVLAITALSEIPPPDLPSLTFRGLVVDADTGEPLAGVPVVAGFEAIEGAPEYAMRQLAGEFGRETGTDGRFEITGLPTATLQLHVQAVLGSKLYLLRQEGFTFDDGIEHRLEISGSNFDLQVPTVVFGTVRDSDTGLPVAGARVSAGGWKAERTDENGRFIMQLDTGRKWQLTASHDFYHDSAPQDFAFTEAQRIEAEFLLDPITTGTILGTAVNAVTGEPIADAVIEIAGQQIRTDASGRFRVDEIESGDIVVSASQSGYRAGRDSLVLEARQTAEATLELQPITTGTIRGIVVDAESGAPLAGAGIRAGERTAVSGEDGRFVVEEVESGNVEVAASLALYLPGSTPVALEAMTTVETRLALDPITWGAVRVDVRDATTGEPIAGANVRIGSLDAPANAEGVFVAERVPAGAVSVAAGHARYHDAQDTIELARDGAAELTLELVPVTTGTVRGIVRNAADQAPIPTAMVTIGNLAAKSGRDGRFEIGEVPAGEVAARANASLFEPGESSFVVEAAGVVEIEILLEPITWGTISGIVVDATTNRPIPDATVTASAIDARTDAEGRFELHRVPAGEVSVASSRAVYVDASTMVTLAAGTTETVALRLTPITWGIVTGRVTDADTGRPLANADVTIGTQAVQSNADGRFSAERVAAGRLQVASTVPAYQPGTVSIDLEAGGEQDVELALIPVRIGTLEGQVVDAKTGEPIPAARVTVGAKGLESGADGRFRFEDVDTGRTVVGARHPDYANGSASADVLPAQSVEVIVRLDLRREDVTSLEAELAKSGTVDLYGIYFDSGRDQFKPSSLPTLRAVLEVMRRAPDRRFLIAGHTDSDGGDDYNQDLSERRATTVIRWLVDNGIDAARLDGAGFGETRPAAPNDTITGKALNRRVQLSYTD